MRAEVCRKPEEYRWCSYGAALGGDADSRRGLAVAFGRTRWTETLACDYRLLLFGQGQEVEGGATPRGEVKARRGFTREEVEEEKKRGGKLPLHEALLCRVRYFSAGAVIGSRGYVEEMFEQHRDRFGPARETGARKMRGAGWGGLASLRDLGKALQ